MNLDSRATDINTESGLLIASPVLASQLGALIETLGNEQNSWKVSQDENGRLRWESRGITGYFNRLPGGSRSF